MEPEQILPKVLMGEIHIQYIAERNLPVRTQVGISPPEFLTKSEMLQETHP